MKNRIILILVLMSVCVAAIIGLQLFWNYQNYKNTVKTFSYDVNDALNIAVNKEIDQRHQKIITKFKGWLADTSFVQITCDNNNREEKTVFHLADTHPYIKGQKGTSLGIIDFKDKLKAITPGAKKFFISHFGDNILKGDLVKGNIYYYTQRLGDSLSRVYDQSKVSLNNLHQLYKQELLLKGINDSFELNTNEQHAYLTQHVNSALRRPYQKEFVLAGFQSPDSHFIKEMKWLIITSLLLISITLFCFIYTSRTLLSQHKLAQMKDDFMNNMTHEINTPLSSIAITAEALKRFDYNKQTQHGYLDIINYQVNKLTSLVTQLLEMGNLDKRTHENDILIDLDKIIQKAITDMSPQIENKGAIINYISNKQNLRITGEFKDILNAFTNIIDNALKYNEGITILRITLQYTSRYAIISFADNGTGIPIVYKDKIFDRFFRIPTGNTHDVKGYGLGLSYVKQVVKYHKGVISVVANNPSGSIFTFKLPIE